MIRTEIILYMGNTHTTTNAYITINIEDLNNHTILIEILHVLTLLFGYRLCEFNFN